MYDRNPVAPWAEIDGLAALRERAVRPASNYTARSVPDYRQASVRLEADHILWQR